MERFGPLSWISILKLEKLLTTVTVYQLTAVAEFAPIDIDQRKCVCYFKLSLLNNKAIQSMLLDIAVRWILWL